MHRRPFRRKRRLGLAPLSRSENHPDPAPRSVGQPALLLHLGPRESARLASAVSPVAMAHTSYGCKMTCSFCIVPFLSGTTHMPRLVDVVAEDIARIKVDHVYFADDENFIDERFGFELAEALERRGVKKRYFAWARATTILRYPEPLRRWKEIGLDGVFVGFEFVTNQELKATHKGGTVAHNERAHDTLRRLGIACHAAFMVRPGTATPSFGVCATM